MPRRLTQVTAGLGTVLPALALAPAPAPGLGLGTSGRALRLADLSPVGLARCRSSARNRILASPAAGNRVRSRIPVSKVVPRSPGSPAWCRNPVPRSLESRVWHRSLVPHRMGNRAWHRSPVPHRMGNRAWHRSPGSQARHRSSASRVVPRSLGSPAQRRSPDSRALPYRPGSQARHRNPATRVVPRRMGSRARRRNPAIGHRSKPGRCILASSSPSRTSSSTRRRSTRRTPRSRARSPLLRKVRSTGPRRSNRRRVRRSGRPSCVGSRPRRRVSFVVGVPCPRRPTPVRRPIRCRRAGGSRT